MVNTKGFENKPQANSEKNVGKQGGKSSEVASGGKVYGVNNPRGMEPKSHGSVGLDSMIGSQNGVMPKVGK